jgi:two-component system, OmpR family, response regulator BaeR
MTAAAHILVVEDEPKLATLLRDYLERDGYRTTMLHDGAAVVAWVRQHAPDLVLLDLLLPGKDGLSICRELRSFSELPIIMVTARVEEIDRLLGLEIGADDYICKPFSPREVVARVRALLRRARVNAGPVSERPLQFDDDRFEARLHGKLLPLTRVEYRLLRALAEHPGHVLSRNQLMNSLYLDHRVVSDRTVDSHVKNLRRKLTEAVPDQDLLSSIYGLGYKLDWS